MSKSILYFSDSVPGIKNGHGQVTKNHHDILKNIFGENLYTVVISNNDKNDYENKTVILRENRSKFRKFISVLRGRPPAIIFNHYKTVLDLIRDKGIDEVFIENSMHGELIKKIKKFFFDVKVTVYFPDIEANILKQEMKYSSLKRKIVCRCMIANELKTSKFADRIFVLNARDSSEFKKYYQRDVSAIIPIITNNIYNLNYKNEHTDGEKLRLLFVGGDFWPNIQGINWFIECVEKRIKVPFQLKIVGFEMEKYKSDFESRSTNVNVVGTVDSLHNYYEEADVVIAPILEGSGMKTKTAEALSYGKYIIGTEESLIGYWENVPENLKNNGIYRCVNDIQFSETINLLYHATFATCNKSIQDYVYSQFSYEICLKKMSILLGMDGGNFDKIED